MPSIAANIASAGGGFSILARESLGKVNLWSCPDGVREFRVDEPDPLDSLM
jgi:hypothetical protein